MNTRPNAHAGVTLLDLLVVIGILIILAGVAIVAGNSARMRAYNTQALVCGEQIRKAQTLYYSEQQTFADAFSKLNAPMVARCALVSVVEVTATPQGYRYTVAHQRGNTKYTIEDDRASSTTLAGGAENAAGATDTSGGGTVVGAPPTGTGTLNVNFTWLNVLKWTQGALSAPTLTVTGPSGTWTYAPTPDGDDTALSAAVLTNLAPGTYTATYTGPWALRAVMNFSYTTTRTVTVTNGTTRTLNAQVDMHGGSVSPTIMIPASGNVASLTAYLVRYRPDPLSLTARCTGRCWETDPTQWQVETQLNMPLTTWNMGAATGCYGPSGANHCTNQWRTGYSSLSAATNGTYHPHLVLSDLVPINAAAPMMHLQTPEGIPVVDYTTYDWVNVNQNYDQIGFVF